MKRTIIASLIGSIASMATLLSITSDRAMAQISHDMNEMPLHATKQTGQFDQIDQPLWLKGVVTVAGLGLVGLELWWFLLSQSKPRQATTQGEVQEINIRVDGGYEPSQIVVQAGQPVRLNFDRQDPNQCLEEVRFPDFHIAQALTLNQTTPIEFTPNKPGRYEFTCGMNMFRGVVEVQSAEALPSAGNVPDRGNSTSEIVTLET